jgi:hypothetical protein
MRFVPSDLFDSQPFIDTPTLNNTLGVYKGAKECLFFIVVYCFEVFTVPVKPQQRHLLM